MVRSAKVNSWKGFCESINKIPELTRLRKIFAKYIGDVEESLRPSTDLTITPDEALGKLQENNNSPEKKIQDRNILWCTNDLNKLRINTRKI